MNNYEASVRDSSGQHMTLYDEPVNRHPISKAFVGCDQSGTPALWSAVVFFLNQNNAIKHKRNL